MGGDEKNRHACTADDSEVFTSYCKDVPGVKNRPGMIHPVPPKHDDNVQCVFPGAAIDYHEQVPPANYTPPSTVENALRESLRQRVKMSPSNPSVNWGTWNEVVLDGLLLLTDLWYDPANVIEAFVYRVSRGENAKQAAIKMRNEFSTSVGVDHIPVLGIDDTKPFLKVGPFVASEDIRSAQNDVSIV